MRKIARSLLAKSADSLVLAIDRFNASEERGRQTQVLLLLDHSLEMLLKAAIDQRGGRLFSKQTGHAIGFAECVNRGLSTGRFRFLNEQQCVALRHVNGLRDAEYHGLIDVDESELYIVVQEGVTVARDILREVFAIDLVGWLPRRVLPVSTQPLTDVLAVFDRKIARIKELLAPGTRRNIEARAAMASLTVLDSALAGLDQPPTETELRRKLSQLAQGERFESVLPRVSTMDISSEGRGPAISLRITKQGEVPVQLANADNSPAPDTPLIASRRVSETGYYKFGLKDIGRHVGLGQHDVLCLVTLLNLKHDADCFRVIRIGKSEHKRYSDVALDAVREAHQTGRLPEAKTEYQRLMARQRQERSLRAQQRAS